MFRRNLQDVVERALRDMPVVLVIGARQSGKTTLVRKVAEGQNGMRYVTLDDAATLAAAQADPGGFVAGLGDRVVFDEVQKAPDLFPALKVAVDRRRAPGRFLLTGSADVLALPSLSESLAGRMEPRVLWPLSQGEIAGVEEHFVGSMLARDPPRPIVTGSDRSDVVRRALQGGFPDVFRRSEDRRRAWFDAYVTTILQRDVRDLADIEHLSAMPRILSLLAMRASSLLNTTDLSRTTGVPNTTLQRYLALLEHTFLLRLLPAWSSNRSTRLIKTPKVTLVDTGLLAHLGGISAARLRREPDLAGSLLENLVAVELWKQLGWSSSRAELFHFRTHKGREVDLVIEADDGRIVGIEVKAAATIDHRHFAGLEALREISGARFHRGVVLYTGAEPLPFGKRMFALPLASVWTMGVDRAG